MTTRQAVIDEARRWLGVPYLHQGRSRRGVDCIGLLIKAAHGLGISEYDVTGYGRTPDAGFLQAECDRLMARIDEPAPGDVLLMRFTREPQHVAIVSDVGIIHAWYGARKVVETSFSPSWRHRVVQAYAIPGVA